MRCQGRPEDGRCPDNKNDNTVHNTIGDLFLCNACEEYRWPTVGATAKLPISGAFASRKPNTRQNMKSTTEKPTTKKAPVKAGPIPSAFLTTRETMDMTKAPRILSPHHFLAVIMIMLMNKMLRL